MFGVSLRVRTYERSERLVVLVSCPACGYQFDRDERRHKHLGEHDPEDFGLNPLGEIDPDHDDPMFDDPVPDDYQRTVIAGPVPQDDTSVLVDHLTNAGVDADEITVDEYERTIAIGPRPHEQIPSLIERLTNSGISSDTISVTDATEGLADGA